VFIFVYFATTGEGGGRGLFEKLRHFAKQFNDAMGSEGLCVPRLKNHHHEDHLRLNQQTATPTAAAPEFINYVSPPCINPLLLPSYRVAATIMRCRVKSFAALDVKTAPAASFAAVGGTKVSPEADRPAKVYDAWLASSLMLALLREAAACCPAADDSA